LQVNEDEQLQHSKAVRKLIRTYKRVFDNKDGREIIADMGKQCRWADDVFFPGEPDQTAYYLGMQRLLKRVLSFIEMDDSTALRIVRSQEVKLNE
jgi:hypothetical protein